MQEKFSLSNSSFRSNSPHRRSSIKKKSNADNLYSKNSDLKDTNILTEIDSNDDTALIDKIIMEYGFGWHIVKIIICATLFFIVNGIQNSYVAFMINGYISLFNLQETSVIFLTSIFFCFKTLGAISLGYVTMYINRLLVLNISILVCASGFLVTIIFPNNLVLLFISRAMGGLASGLAEPIVVNSLCEIAPINWRGLILNSIWTGFGIGELIVLLIMLGYMPNFEAIGIQNTIIFNFVITILCGIFCFIFFDDSPRDYIIHGNDTKAKRILLNFKSNLKENEWEQIKDEVQNGINDDVESGIPQLFKDGYLLITILFMLIGMLGVSLVEGTLTLVPLVLGKYQEIQFAPLIQLILMIFISLPAHILGGLLCEVKMFGRRFTICAGYGLAAVFCLMVPIFPKFTFAFMGLYYFFLIFACIVGVTYTSEIYPTVMRDTAAGFLSSVAFLFGSLAHLLFIHLFYKSMVIPFYVMSGVATIAAILTIFIPIETNQQPVDVQINKLIKKDKKLEEEQQALI